MSDRLFVLAERTGKRLLNTEGVDVSLYEFFVVEAGGLRYVSLFLSRLDTELIRIGENGHGNAYVLMESSLPALVFYMRELEDLHCALILGFAGTKDGCLLRYPTGQLSSCHMALLPDDEDWLFRGKPRPERNVVTDAKRAYADAGLGSHLDEIEEINKLGEQELRVRAEEALRCANIAASGNGSRLMVYSVGRKSWRAGRCSA